MELEVCPPTLKVTDPKLRSSPNVQSLDIASVKERLRSVKKELTDTKKLHCTEYNKLCDVLSFTEKTCYRSLLTSYYNKELDKVNVRHRKKLFNLWKKSGNKAANNCIINISSVELTAHEVNALQFGLKHHILPSSFESDKIKKSIERTLNEVTWKSQIAMDYSTKEDIRHAYYQYENACKSMFWSRKNIALHRTLTSLSRNEKIRVCSMDKGVGVVIMNADEYYSKLDTIISDTSKFQEVIIPPDKDHPIIAKESSINYYVKKYVKNVDDKLHKQLLSSGSSPGKLYGLCKVHKSNYPLRPVISMVNTPEYKLAKYLDDFIKPNIPSKFMLSSTNEFVSKLSSFPLCGSEKLVSFDVTSLFTNIPLIETIDIVMNRIYSDNAVVTPDIPKKFFRKMLLLCTQGMFMYRDVLYRQIDGVAMGSSLGPTLANMFLAHVECEKLFNDITNNYPVFYPNLYLRYVDDCFAVFNSEPDSVQFLSVLNSLHSNLQFTVEVGSTSLPFLDVLVNINVNSFETSVYRKETHTGVFLNFNAAAPNQWKRGLILCLLNRAKSICSSPRLFNDEVNRLKKLFIDNCYPARYFENALKRITNPTQHQDDLDESDVFSIFRVPYYDRSSMKFAKRISKIISDKFNISIRVVYSTYKVKNYFQLKCRTPLPLLSKVVYRFTCVQDTHISYIGYTKRHMTTRVTEHTDPKYAKKSHVFGHIKACSACSAANIDLSNFEIVKVCRDIVDSKLSEAFAIKKSKPIINKQLFANGSSLILNVWN